MNRDSQGMIDTITYRVKNLSSDEIFSLFVDENKAHLGSVTLYSGASKLNDPYLNFATSAHRDMKGSFIILQPGSAQEISLEMRDYVIENQLSEISESHEHVTLMLSINIPMFSPESEIDHYSIKGELRASYTMREVELIRPVNTGL